MMLGVKDETILKQMGYDQVLYRGFNSFMSFTFCFTAVSVIPSIAGLFSTFALPTGGPVVLVWSWIFGSIATFIVGLCLAEICSTYPSAGAVYHWAGSLAPKEWSPLASYTTGWFNTLGNAAGGAFFANAFAAGINNLVILNGGEAFSIGIQTAIGLGISFVWTFMNLFRVDYLGYITNFAAIFQMLGSVVIVVSLFATCPQSGNNAALNDMFFSWYNGTGFSDVYVAFIGCLVVSFSLTGYEASAHMVLICVILSRIILCSLKKLKKPSKQHLDQLY